MEGPDRSGERAEKMIDVSLRALRRMRRLIDDFFTIERLLEQGYDLRRERLSIKDLVEGSVQLLAEKDGIDTSAWASELDDGEVMGDGDMLRKAVRAAIEYMARATPKPRLSLAAREGVLLVRSDAPPAPILPLDPEDRQSGDPTGSVLGFALAARVLEAHGGRVEERDGALALVFPAP